MGDIQSLITDVGFPIAMVLVMVWFIFQSTKWHREDSKEWREAITNNTLVIGKLISVLEAAKDE